MNNNIKHLTRSAIAVSILASSVFASTVQAKQDEWQFKAGLGVFTTNQAWTGIDSYQGVVPLLSAEYGNWSFGDEAIVAYHLLNEEDFGIAVGINYRDDAYDNNKAFGSSRSDAEVFKGYKSPNGDITFKVDTYWQLFTLSLEQDISGESKGLTADLGIEVPLYNIGKNFLLQAEAGVHWSSSDYNQHTYGISGDQIDASVGRTAYNLGSTTSYSLGLTAFYKLNRDWDLMASVQHVKLADDIADSPLLDSDSTTSMFVGATYSF